jgi:UDP-N-acetylglucosamine 2-epimerase (non-hydrolysing)
MKIAIVYGTRPELIKLVPLILLMKKDERIQLTIINTGQHKEMVDDLERLFGVNADHKLEIMSHNQSLTDINQRITKKVEPVLKTFIRTWCCSGEPQR